MKYPAVLLCALLCGSAYAQPTGSAPDVLFQGFHWNVHPGDHATDDGAVWWDSLATVTPRLAAGGVQTVWIPSPSKGMGGRWSMGYDLYDYYDLGALDQKGSVRTRFGTEAEFTNAIATMKGQGLRIMADVVLNHRFGADARSNVACVPGDGPPYQDWNVYTPASGRLPADANSFHPNNADCNLDPPYHNAIFGQDLSYFYDINTSLGSGQSWYHGPHTLGAVGDSLIVFGRWLMDEVGADEIRLDAIKHIDPAFLAPWIVEIAETQPFVLGEFWSGTSEILAYHAEAESFVSTRGTGSRDANMAMFDFPLRYALRDMANGGGSYDMWNLNSAGLHFSGLDAFDVVTFVENHDVDRIGWVWADCTEADAVQTGSTCVKLGNDVGHDPITQRKHLGYAVIMAAEGRPTVFWKDYLWYGLGDEIDWLMALRRMTAQGESTPISGMNPFFVSGNGGDLWALRRDGFGSPRYGAVLTVNDAASGEASAWVNTPHADYELKDYSGAYPFETTTAFGDSRALVKARGGSYAWWAPTGLYPRAMDEPASAFTLTAEPGGTLHHLVLRADDAAAFRVNGAPIQPGDEVAVLAPGASASVASPEVAGLGRVGQRLRWTGTHDLVIEVLGNGANVGAGANRLADGDALRLVVFDADTQQMHEAGTVTWAAASTTFTFNPHRPASMGGAFSYSTTDDDGLFTAGAVSLVTGFEAGASTPSIVLTGEPGWRMLTLPYPDLGLGGNGPDGSGRLAPGLLQPIYTAGYQDADRDQDNNRGYANVFTYDEPTRSYVVPETSSSIPHGRGFWLYLFEDDDPHVAGTQGTFPKVLSATGTPLTTAHDFGVTFTTGGSFPDGSFPGGHLLGNPFDQNLAWDHPSWTKTRVATTIYVYEPETNTYLSWTTGVGGTLPNGEIPVGQAFFAYATGANPSLIAPSAARTGEWMPVNGLAGRADDPKAGLPHVRLTARARLGDATEEAVAIVALAEDASVGFDERDALALAGGPLRLMAASPEGHALTVAAVPGVAEIPLHAEALADGGATVALAWEAVDLGDDWAVTLRDRQTGTVYDLSAPGEATVDVREGTPETAEDGSIPAPRVLRLDPQDARFVVSVQGRSTATEAGEAFALALGSPAPNPSRGTVTVPFVLDAPRAVRLSVIDALGREVVVIADGAFVSGPHEATVDASALAPGVYTVRLQAGTEMRSHRVTVVR